jgi:hypothetical protein
MFLKVEMFNGFMDGYDAKLRVFKIIFMIFDNFLKSCTKFFVYPEK